MKNQSTAQLCTLVQTLLAKPYGKARNKALWAAQKALEQRGITYSQQGTPRKAITAQNVSGFQLLSVGGGK